MTLPIVSMKSDLHPYECGQNCVHCRKAVEDGHRPADCAFCWDPLITPETAGLYLAIFYGPLYPMLRSHGEYDVMHRGQEYTVFTEGEAAIEDLGYLYIREQGHSGPTYTYRFKLTGAHGGPPIEILMVNPTDESDGYGGRDFVWERLIWADDHSPFDHDYFDDAYTDPLRDELSAIAKGWD